MTALKKKQRCQDLVQEQWKDRQQDLQNPDYEALSFDYVAPHTFTDQAEGYWRWQFSWGGPGDELRGYVNENDELHRLEYWYLDWFDGASIQIQAEHAAWELMQQNINHTAPNTVAAPVGMWEDLSGPERSTS